MENLLDLTTTDETRQVEAAQVTAAIEALETEATTQPLADLESEATVAPDIIEEIDTAPKAEVTKALPGKAVTKPVPYKR